MSSSRKSRWPKSLLVVVLLAIAVAGGGWYYQRYSKETPVFQTTTVSRGELLQIVTTSGQLNPVVKVEVGSQISGTIQKLLVDFNSNVKEGQVIAQLDPAAYEANFIQAEGNLANAKAALELAQLNAERAKTLRADKLNPQADYDKALADLHQAQANVKINEGALKRAQVDVAHCTIATPISGIVISRNVNVGQTVAASLSAPTLFVIANDLSKMEIEANVAEADIGMVEAGQSASFTVDAFPGQIFQGKVTQIRNAPKSDQNVVTYDTMIEVSNPNLKLKPGMTANISIIVARREKALKIPNAALRFRPPEGVTLKKSASSSPEPETDAASSKTGKSRNKKNKRKTEKMVYVLSKSEAVTNTASPGLEIPILQPTPIKTGISDNASTEVLEGLQEGDQIVVAVAANKTSPRLLANPFATSRKKN
jgi:HlyD family secretion protein